jgi:hypothetical protein
LQSGETRYEKSGNYQETRLLSPDEKHAYVVNCTQIGENIVGRHTIRPSLDEQKIVLVKKGSSESTEYQMILIDSEGKQLGNVLATFY